MRTLAVCAVAGVLSACGAGLAPAFDLRFPDNAPERTKDALALAGERAPAPPAEPGLVVASTHGAEPELLAYDIERETLRFRVALAADSRPALLGDLVVVASAGRLVALEATAGKVRFSVELGEGVYLGAARAGDRLFAVTTRAGTGAQRKSSRLLALDARTGRSLWERVGEGAIGAPAAVGQLVAVPWQRQSLALLDARDGREVARVRSRDDVIDWVRQSGGTLYFGHRRIHRLDDYATGEGAVRPGTTVAAERTLPGDPAVFPSGFSGTPGRRSAHGRVSLHYALESGGEAGAALVDRYYLLFYRYVFAFDATGALQWARVMAHDAIAAQATEDGLWLLGDSGELTWLAESSGAQGAVRAIGVPLASAEIDAAAVKTEVSTAAQAPALRQALTTVALDPDNRLVPARAFALARLAALPDPEVTRDLLDVYAQTTTPPILKEHVSRLVRARRTGSEYLVDALLARYDFLDQTRPAPLSVIVPALVEAHETRAVPRLVDRMWDHETPAPMLPAVIRAIIDLGDATVIEPLIAFLRMYRADSSFRSDPEALVVAAEGVLRLAGVEGRDLLAALAADPTTSPKLADALAERLAPARPSSTATAAAPPPAPEAQPLPERLEQSAINAAFADHVDDLRACIIDEIGRNPRLSQVRIAFVVEGDGSGHAFTFAPNTQEFADCLYPKVREFRFARFRRPRQLARYVISVQAQERPSPSEQGPTIAAGAPFWARAAADAHYEVEPDSGPWWHSHQAIAPTTEARDARPSATPPANATPPASSTPPASATTPTASDDGTSQTRDAPATTSTAEPEPEPTPPTPPEPEDTWWVPSQPSAD